MAASDRSYPSVWARPPRKERSALSRAQIVTEAIRVLDADGIEALSMRKLAAGLGAGTASLYWHVANRDELIELILDEVHGEVDVPGPGEADDWQAATRRFAHSVRAAILRHTWMVSMLDHLVVAFLGPNAARVSEQMLGLLEAAGFPLAEAERALGAVSSYVMGVAMSEAAFRNSLERQGRSEADWMAASMRAADHATEEFPRLRTVVNEYVGKDVQRAMEDDFDYGLDCVLVGLRYRLAAIS